MSFIAKERKKRKVERRTMNKETRKGGNQEIVFLLSWLPYSNFAFFALFALSR
jgi:hypothetical protein